MTRKREYISRLIEPASSPSQSTDPPLILESLRETFADDDLSPLSISLHP